VGASGCQWDSKKEEKHPQKKKKRKDEKVDQKTFEKKNTHEKRVSGADCKGKGAKIKAAARK